MRTPNELFTAFNEIRRDATQGIIELMKSHEVNSLNTKTYMYDYGYEFVDISVYLRKMDAMFYEPVSMVTLDEDGLHLFYDGEESGECYDPSVIDMMNVYSLVYDIFEDVDNGKMDLFTEPDSEEE
jgi:hypothetical protein